MITRLSIADYRPEGEELHIRDGAAQQDEGVRERVRDENLEHAAQDFESAEGGSVVIEDVQAGRPGGRYQDGSWDQQWERDR